MNRIKRFFRNEEGVTAIEYGLIAAGIGIAISVIVYSVGDQLVVLFESILTALTPA